MAQGTIIRFNYAGKVRECKVIIDSAEYVKAENLTCDGEKPARPFSNYSKSEMEGLTILS